MRLLVAREYLHVIEKVVGAFAGRADVGRCGGGGCGGEVELFEEGDGDVGGGGAGGGR